MKKKISLAEKRLLRTVIILVLIQLLVIFAFVHLLISSRQVNISDTVRIDITVDDLYFVRVPKEDWLVIVADNIKYLFMSRSTTKDYSVHELYDSIAKGDRLSIIYYISDNTVLGKYNVIVDARTEAEDYRTLEAYNQGKQGVTVFIAILFVVIELIFAGVTFLYFWLNWSIINSAYKKFKFNS